MTQYTCDPALEISGQTVLSLFKNENYHNIKNILAQNNLTEINPEGWYSMQHILNVIKEITEAPGSTFNLVSIGVATAQLGKLPPDVETKPLADFFALYEKIYLTRFRNGDAGSIKTEQLTPTHLKITYQGAFPDDLVYGVLYGYARRILPPGTFVTFSYDEHLPRADHGAPFTVMHARWE